MFADAGVKVIVEAELTGPPLFTVGAPLSPEETGAIVTAMSRTGAYV